ncbi:MAG TPA: 30S ribosomal protein S20 [Thermoanaerobaculia bacterium]|nr:30S ribosomal protein S20 [Thermoanaerobaculia bacterium]
MANIKSAKKRIRQSEQRRARNKSVRSRLRTAIKKFRSAGDASKPESLPASYSEIDHAEKKGVIHRNAAARYKSRLAKHAVKNR